jgi:hypothetical protein
MSDGEKTQDIEEGSDAMMSDDTFNTMGQINEETQAALDADDKVLADQPSLPSEPLPKGEGQGDEAYDDAKPAGTL